MQKFKCFTVYLLLFSFAMIAAKNLLPEAYHGFNNCDEVGHVHFYHIQTVASSFAEPPLTTDDDECLGGKSFFTYSMFPAVRFKVSVPDFKPGFELVLNIQSNFKTPELEPHRKPPKAV